MQQIRFDYNNMFAHGVGRRHGVSSAEFTAIAPSLRTALEHLRSVIRDDAARVRLSLEWTRLPHQDGSEIRAIQRLGDEIAGSYENVISLGIGGSYLGLKAAQDALCPAYYNEFAPLRKGRPKVYFDGNNMDPDTLSVLLAGLDPRKTFVIVISKSGETTETKAAFTVVEEWLKKRVGALYGRQIVAITDPSSGTLRKKVDAEQSRDMMSFRSLPVMKGVGGRFSELNIGLLHMAIVGIDITKVLAGARAMAKRCELTDLLKNPAAAYAALHTILYRKKGKEIAVLMPFSERLKSTADWYVQLLAESLGKKFARKITVGRSGEEWIENRKRIVNVGRTPIPSRGTNDLHSIQQNNIEGENNKAVTFIKVEKFADDIRIPGSGDLLSGKAYSHLLALAEEATEWALSREERPSCTIIMPEIAPFHWGELLFFFEMATAIEGELLGINAFDQPGVEGYKNYMYYKLGKSGIAADIVNDIRKNPLVKKPRYIV